MCAPRVFLSAAAKQYRVNVSSSVIWKYFTITYQNYK